MYQADGFQAASRCPWALRWIVPVASLLVMPSLLTGCSRSHSGSGAQADTRPNIVFIMADDLGWASTSDDLTNMGSPSSFFQTPTIASLAVEGMAFTHAYTNAPSCTATRAAYLTGQYAPRPDNNIFSFDRGLNIGNNPAVVLEGIEQGLPESGAAELPESAFTLAEMLQGAGYTTAHVGKYHVGVAGTANGPLNQGFDYNYGGGNGGSPGDYHADLEDDTFGKPVGPELDAFATPYTQQYVDDNIKPYSTGIADVQIDVLVGTPKHITDAVVDAAIEFLDAHNDDPFYLQLFPYAIHTPIDDAQARLDLLAKYQALPPVDDDGDGLESPSYAALIEGLDQSIARILDYLETTPDPRNSGHTLDQNTLLIFYSDNGGRQPEAHHGPLRGEKGTFEEGGIRVPMIAWSANPSLVSGGTVNATPVISIDFFPTFAALVGADLAGLLLDGENLIPLLSGENTSLDREALYWHFPGYFAGGDHDQTPRSIVRIEPWKLYYLYEDQSLELYNLDDDMSESTDLAPTRPDVVAELSSALLEWLDDTDAPLATSVFGTEVEDISGLVYLDGELSYFEDESIVVPPGGEMPMILDGILTCQQIEDLGFPGACTADDD